MSATNFTRHDRVMTPFGKGTVAGFQYITRFGKPSLIHVSEVGHRRIAVILDPDTKWRVEGQKYAFFYPNEVQHLKDVTP